MKKSYRWTVTPPRDPGLIEKLSSEINVPQTITRILVNRGIDSYAGARMFFRPEIADLHDPFLMDGMNLAVDRVLKALELSEKILVFGDYDVDGTSSAAMMVLFLRELGADAISHIPDRVRVCPPPASTVAPITEPPSSSPSTAASPRSNRSSTPGRRAWTSSSATIMNRPTSCRTPSPSSIP